MIRVYLHAFFARETYAIRKLADYFRIKSHGFTVIELMLFLSVTGALFAALMLGVNGNITQQRYQESVDAYSTFLQDQYFEVINTRNERDDGWSCDGGVVSQDPVGGTARGRTSCVLLGRAIEVIDKGERIRTMPVVGTEAGISGQGGVSDLKAITDYKPKLVDDDEEFVSTISIDWGSTLVSPDGQPSTASILILRSPVSGLIRTFAWDTQLPSDLREMIDEVTAKTVLVNCVKSQPGSSPVESSVSVDSRIAGPDAVIVKGADPACE